LLSWFEFDVSDPSQALNDAMRARFDKFLRAFCLSIVISILPELAFAHATPIQYVPAASSILLKAPTEVQIHFSERLEPRGSSIAILAPDGSRADLSNSAPDPADPRVFRVGVRDSGAGSYTVSWEVISSDDGHFTKGAYIFSVGNPSPSATTEGSGFQTVHSSSVPEALTLAVELVGDAMILGALLVLAFIWRLMRRHFPEVKSDEYEFIGRFKFLLRFGCIMALAGGFAYLIYKTSDLASLQEITFSSAWASFLVTTSALFTVYRMLGAGFLLVASQITQKRLFSAERVTKIEYVFFAVLALIDLSRARVSHAAASTFAPAFGVLMNFVHLFFKDAWIGGIIALVVLLSPLIRNSRNPTLAAFVLTAFSRIASVAFGIAGVTGVYVVWLHLKSFSYVLTTDWGKRFAVLSAFAAFLLALRLFAQVYDEPRIVDAIRKSDEKRYLRLLSWLGFTLPAEMTIGIAILAVTSLLIITTPPLAPHYRFVRSDVSQGIVLSLAEQASENGKFLVTAEDPLTKTSADVKNMVVTLTNQAAGVGPIVASVEKRFAGGFVFGKNLLTPPGIWSVDVAAQRVGAYDATATFSLNYPQEVSESDAHSTDRTFGSFEVIHLIVALIILVAAIVLYRKSTELNQFLLNAPEVPPASAALTFARPGAWIPPLILIAGLIYLSGGLPALSPGVLESPFQRVCEETNIMNVWHESVPERAGEATSDLALPGCTVGLGLGQFHFVDAREFAYFVRPARARAQLATNPAALASNVPTTLTFTLRDYQGDPVQDLVPDHNRIIHVVIASKDFSVFSHIHVEDFGPVTTEMLKTAEFPVRYTFPKPGQYLVSVDYTERAYIFSDQFYLNVEPSEAMSAIQNENFALQKSIDGYEVTLKTSPARLKAGAPATLDYHIEKDGMPLREMTPYLAVPMHISIIRDDLMGFLHIHGLLPVSPMGYLLGESIHASHLYLPNKFGPDIEATNFSFPSAGVYHIFGEFSTAGKVVVTHFTVRVE
jgi:methionine-rich copper-binding protein CopC/putative copper export protein